MTGMTEDNLTPGALIKKTFDFNNSTNPTKNNILLDIHVQYFT